QDERNAALRAEAHADTPTTAHFDALGRPFLTIARNRVVWAGDDLDGREESFATRVELDIEGNQRAVLDERKPAINYLPTGALEQRIVMRYDYDMLGNRIHQLSMEAGARWMLNDVAGKPIRTWDSRGHAFITEYDPLRRPVRSFVIGGDPADPNRKVLTERLAYGEQHPEDAMRNLRGKVYMRFDKAGAMINELHDFKGNLLQSSRRLAREYRRTLDWNAADTALAADPTAKLDPAALEIAIAPLLEGETFSSNSS